MWLKRLAVVLFGLLAVAGCSEDRREAMVATADGRASEVARDILVAGGSAVDAAIAAQMVLGLVEPQSSGIGGGAFLLNWDAATRTIDAYDGRETAPAEARPDLFLDETGKPLDFMEAVVGGHSVGVPGVIAMLWQAHQDHGRLAWAELFKPAIRMAREGFVISGRLAEAIAEARPLLQNPAARAYLFMTDMSVPDGALPLPAGAVIRNEAYARTLERIAEKGAAGFYEGPVADAIVEAVRDNPNPGSMTLADLATYRPIKREAVCGPYRHFRICGMPAPSSGGLTTLMILGMLEHFRMDELRPDGVMANHLLAEASALAFADRDRYMADPDHVAVPSAGLIDRQYLAERARLIDLGKAMGRAEPGMPPGAPLRAEGLDRARAGTSHLSIVDGDGNAVSMTTTIEGPFGAHIMAAGFFLNNELTDFSFMPTGADGTPVANAVAPGKRPRSSMAPTLVFDGNRELVGVVGSPGGSRIIGYVTQTLLGLIDWKMTMQEAIGLPRVLDRNGPIELEERRPVVRLAPALEEMGHKVSIRPSISGLQGIWRRGDRLEGGADRRREGVVLGATAAR